MTTESPLWVYYEHIATRESLANPTRFDGEIGSSYQIETPDISDYTYVDNSGRLTGIFGSTPQSLYLYYCPNDWREVHRISMYIRVNLDMVAYQEPQDDATASVNLSANTYWATPLRVIASNGQFWYQIGDHAWIRYEASLMTLSDTAPSAENINYINEHGVENDQPNALINFLPGQSTEVFAAPYGLPIGSVLDGDFVAITETQTHDNGLTWYKLANHGWINSLYVDQL